VLIPPAPQPAGLDSASSSRRAEQGCTALAEALRKNDTLKKLLLEANQITAVGCAALSEVLSLRS
jgi:hypothetical protein